jgi:hypothetical protein
MVHLIDLVPATRLGQDKKVAAYRDDLGVAVLYDILDLSFIEQEMGSNLEEG